MNTVKTPPAPVKSLEFCSQESPEQIIPVEAFLHPQGQNVQQVRELLQQVLEVTLQELSAARQLATVPLDWPNISDEQLIPSEPLGPESIISACRTLLRGSMNPAHPRYMGHMDPLPSTGSVAAALVTAAVNNNLLSREMSPVFSDLEQRLLKGLASLFGFPSTAGGFLQTGGTLCNLQALTVARNTHFDIHTHGLYGIKKQPVLFASEHCHSSMQKSAMILGLGTAAVIPVKGDSRGKMCPEALTNAIQLSLKNDQQPFAVVATAGTTVTGNIDPLPEIAEICQRFGLWLHVDASYGGAMIFSPNERHRLQGIEQANSITFNPQKWCYVTKVCALVMFRDEEVLNRSFRIAAPYMSLNEPQGHVNFGEWGIQGTRSPDIAKWWLTLLQLGQSGLGKLVDHSVQTAQMFLQHVRSRDYLELATEPEMNILCFRDLRNGHDNLTWGKQNTALQKHLMDEGETFVSLPHFRGSRWLKAVLLNPFTTAEDIQEIFAAIDRFRP